MPFEYQTRFQRFRNQTFNKMTTFIIFIPNKSGIIWRSVFWVKRILELIFSLKFEDFSNPYFCYDLQISEGRHKHTTPERQHLLYRVRVRKDLDPIWLSAKCRDTFDQVRVSMDQDWTNQRTKNDGTLGNNSGTENTRVTTIHVTVELDFVWGLLWKH